MSVYVIVFAGAALLALGCAPLVIRVAHRLGLMDDPDTRKIHDDAVPCVGGLAIILPVFAAAVPAFALSGEIGQDFRELHVQVLAVLAGSVVIFGVGLVDDIRTLSARTKFLVQLLCAAAACAGGVLIENIQIAENVTLHLGWLAYPVTVLWIAGVTNAVNLIDGLDGLAVGIALMACAVIAAIAGVIHWPVTTVLILALAGGLAGFLPYNLHPAKIFLGDSGSLFVGYFLATATILGWRRATPATALLLPALALGVPILDTFFAIVRRIAGRRPIFAADQEHIHHRLLKKGFTQPKVVAILYGVTLALCGLGAIGLTVRGSGKLLLTAIGLLGVVAFFWWAGVRVPRGAGRAAD